MTWRDVQICLLGNERKELNEWRRIRALSHIIYATQGGDKNMYQFFPLPGDPKEEQRIPLTEEELAKVFSMYK